MLTDQGVEVLSEEDCYALLRTGTIGRVGLSIGALPAILPVSYSMVDGTIVFRTGDGVRLRAAFDQTVVAFEIDFSDPDHQEGWSVLVVGVAELVDAPVVDLRASSVERDRPYVVRIRPETVTGRRGPLA
jgi:nitroimidazol reductase NimA-like FMN-containing flavoprotein (pyridoxamine 5'-phosphate oxidase superfamily)